MRLATLIPCLCVVLAACAAPPVPAEAEPAPAAVRVVPPGETDDLPAHVFLSMLEQVRAEHWPIADVTVIRDGLPPELTAELLAPRGLVLADGCRGPFSVRLLSVEKTGEGRYDAILLSMRRDRAASRHRYVIDCRGGICTAVEGMAGEFDVFSGCPPGR